MRSFSKRLSSRKGKEKIPRHSEQPSTSIPAMPPLQQYIPPVEYRPTAGQVIQYPQEVNANSTPRAVQLDDVNEGYSSPPVSVKATEFKLDSNPTPAKADLFRETAGTDLRMETDRTLFSMPMPENVDAMTDLIKLHEPGDNFPYVGVVGNEGESLDATRARLLAMKPQYNSSSVPEFSVEACSLINTRGQFSMQNLLDHAKSVEPPVPKGNGIMPTYRGVKKFEIVKNYAQIKAIKIVYTPNMSSTADYCKFWVTLTDTRMINNTKSGPCVGIVSNQEGVVEMGCDYCVSTADMGCFVLSYELEREIMKAGYQWGTMTLYFNVVESDIPFQAVKRDTMAVYRMPISTLVDRKTDPDKVDISFTSKDIEALRKMMMAGEVVDVDAPQAARLKRSSYSKSTLRGGPKGEVMAGAFGEVKGWEHMAGARKPLVDAMTASVSVADDEDPDDVDPESLRQSKEAWAREQERLGGGVEVKNSTKEVATESIQPQDELTRLFTATHNAGKGVRFQEDAV